MRPLVTAGSILLSAVAHAQVGSLDLAGLTQAEPREPARPSVVWIMAEDIGPELSCYGHPAVDTPHLDRLAREGARFTRAFGTAASCTPARNAMMTGVYQTRTGTQDQRRRGIQLPDGIEPITHLLQEAGYYTALGCGYSKKTDLNFDVENLFDGDDWRERSEGQPFFAQITLGDSHRQEDGWDSVHARAENPVDPDDVELPPYLPDRSECREDWARYLEAVQSVDRKVGEILTRLEREGLADDTVVIFIGDNGRCHLRGKCWLYDAGLHVPLVVRWPGEIAPARVIDDLVSTIDVSATVLDIAGVPLPAYLDGHPIVGGGRQRRGEVFAARDLVDEVWDCIRCVRTPRYKYIRNYRPEIGYRECAYVQDHRPMLAVIRELGARGELDAAQRLILTDRKPREELYDVVADPHELTNLAGAARHATTLAELRSTLDEWIRQTDDQGLARLKASRPGRADATDYLSEVVAELRRKWPENRTITIAAHGHSVPAGYFKAGRVETFKAYPHLLHRKLCEAFPTAVINVIPTGIGGETSDRGSLRFEDEVLGFRPDVVTIDYGLNDRRIGLEKARRAWAEMIRAAQASGAKVILLTPTGDTGAVLSDLYDPLSQHAQQIRCLAEEFGVGLVDSYQSFADFESRNGSIQPLMSQGNHPNQQGHALVARELASWFTGASAK